MRDSKTFERSIYFFIPQFDYISLGAQMFGILVSFCLYYVYHMKQTLPNFIEVKKFRNKKISYESDTLEVCFNYTLGVKTNNFDNYNYQMNYVYNDS